MSEEIKKSEIEEVYLFEMGSLFINRKRELLSYLKRKGGGESSEDLFRDFFTETNGEFKKEVKKTLENSEEIKLFDEEETRSSEMFGEKVLKTRFWNPLHVTVNLKEFEKIQSFEIGLGEKDIPIPSLINIVYDGSNYLYYRKYILDQVFFLEGANVRDYLKKVLKTNFEVGMVGPTPLRERFILIVLKTKKFRPPIVDDLGVIYFTDKVGDPKMFFSFLLGQMSFSLDLFYNGQQFQELLNLANHEFREEFSRIFKLMSQLEKTKKLFFLKKRKIIKKIHMKLLRLNKIMGDYIGFEQELFECKKSFLRFIQRDLFLSPMKKKFIELFEYKKLNYDSIVKTFPFIRDYIEGYHKKSRLIWTLLFSLFSVAIGAFLTYILVS